MVPVPAHRLRYGRLIMKGKRDTFLDDLHDIMRREAAAEERLARAVFSIHPEVSERAEKVQHG